MGVELTPLSSAQIKQGLLTEMIMCPYKGLLPLQIFQRNNRFLLLGIYTDGLRFSERRSLWSVVASRQCGAGRGRAWRSDTGEKCRKGLQVFDTQSPGATSASDASHLRGL
ncbi:hypothetical protein SKAU_G00038020 [Synaphobranchus kaupii]|uniref:Uncharacterized protein n=1 Tax=Synaphobranchus kaupii TaxID=118154 RepID=A0A9Q1JHI9_SYNKA|nr:hypothetical protein SKAU_G00038020 [Synaphobranchus kaupii]